MPCPLDRSPASTALEAIDGASHDLGEVSAWLRAAAVAIGELRTENETLRRKLKTARRRIDREGARR